MEGGGLDDEDTNVGKKPNLGESPEAAHLDDEDTDVGRRPEGVGDRAGEPQPGEEADEASSEPQDAAGFEPVKAEEEQ